MRSLATLLGVLAAGTIAFNPGCSSSPVTVPDEGGPGPDTVDSGPGPGPDTGNPAPDQQPDGPVKPPPPPPPSCDNLLPSCLLNQQTCVLRDDSPVCEPCPQGFAPDRRGGGGCKPLQGEMTENDFAEFTVQPGEEILGLCQSWTLNNPTELWVNAVEFEQNNASHHSNWTFAANTEFDGPDGVWDCNDRGYDTLNAALAGGVLYAQSTQTDREVQKFADGAAVRIPPYSRIIGDVHLLNAGFTEVTGRVRMRLYSIPVEDVKVKLVPFHFTYRGLDIPPRSQTTFFGECDLKAAFQSSAGTDVTSKLYYLLPHHHALGTRFFVDILGGAMDGTRLIETEGYDSGAHGLAYDPPINLDGIDGIRFGCDFMNTYDERLEWGYGINEMCDLLGFADQSLSWVAGVQTADAAGKDGEKQLFTGPCQTIPLPWDHNRPGGEPR